MSFEEAINLYYNNKEIRKEFECLTKEEIEEIDNAIGVVEKLISDIEFYKSQKQEIFEKQLVNKITTIVNGNAWTKNELAFDSLTEALEEFGKLKRGE